MKTRISFVKLSVLIILLCCLIGCVNAPMKLFTDESDPLKEFTIEGNGQGKILVLPIDGQISDTPKSGMFRDQPSMLQEVVSQLRLAQKDKNVRALLLKINSPGGSATVSDIMYNEIVRFKKKTGAKVIAMMMDVAASGGYYVSLPADLIMAHPTTVTGSVGVILMRPKIHGLMDKIGVSMELNKSGLKKDMGSPFRDATQEEVDILQGLTNKLGQKFLDLVKQHRKITPAHLEEVSSARIFLADEALTMGLIDKIGYVNDAIDEAKKMAGLEKNARVIVYRRTTYPNDNIYNTTTLQSHPVKFSMFDISPPLSMVTMSPGFYYLWTPAAE